MVKISLVMPTLSRTEEIGHFIESLTLQSYKDFELIIVDQNEDDRLMSYVSEFNKKIDILYIKSKLKGLSLNRNIGVKRASGAIIAFPDDDCIYNDPNTLAYVADFFHRSDYNILSLNTIDSETHIPVVKLLKDSCEIVWSNVFLTSISFTIFLNGIERQHLIFDEKLGVGALYGSSEESDLLFNLLDAGYSGYYDSSICIHHPAKQEKLNSDKGYNYGLGMGALYKKNIFNRKKSSDILKYTLMLIKPLVALILLRNPSFYWNTLKGRIIGFKNYGGDERISN